ncbi:MAG TPA: L-histidine N(alpha)-methyltransferase [Burkholderiaceae bacterium]|nr:L-histidine N(alpha)-methyltransferase [Burkholderiaceae bacterium]
MNDALVMTPFTAARSAVGRVATAPVSRPASVHPFRPVHELWPRSVAPSFERDVLSGLAQAQKTIPSTWLYDHRGSELFEQITLVESYYPTRNEVQILQAAAREIAEAAGPRAIIIELGSGSSRKTRLLLDAFDTPQAYLPIDISEQFLRESVAELPSLYAGLRVMPIVADFTRIESLHELTYLYASGADPGRRVVFFPGSTIGNFMPEAAVALLRRIRRWAGPDALLIVGTDSTQDPAVLIPAYDDREGVTAEFNMNLLVRINRELMADFSLDAFRHEARFDAQIRRVEMHLVSCCAQRVDVGGRRFNFSAGESIHTKNSYKYSLHGFQQLAARAGWVHTQRWIDGQARLAVHVLEPIAGARDQLLMAG